MFRYETHLHTFPASKCGKASVRECVEFYHSLGYAGIFITNHFLDGNASADKSLPYEERLDLYFADYEEGVAIGKELGISVFFGAEMSQTGEGTDFLVYGLDKAWYKAHPEIMQMKKSEELPYLIENGALVVHAHPYREDDYIDHIHLFPRCVDGVEVVNANRPELENRMAELYAENYGLLRLAGSDNHLGNRQIYFAGVEFDTPLKDEQDFVRRVKSGQANIFVTKTSYWPK